MKYILIGGSGFIGQHFKRKIKTPDLINIDIDSGVNESEFIYCDITNYSQLESLKLSQYEDITIILLAAVHFDFQKNYFKTNVDGTNNVLKYMSLNSNVKKFVFFSSVATYGESFLGKCENSDQEPINDYGKSKLIAEKNIIDWHELNKNIQTIIVRPAVVFGEYNFGNVFNLVMQIQSGYFAVIGDGMNIKSIAYAGNLVDSVLFSLKNVKKSFFVYNYSDYPQKNIYEQSKTLSKLLGNKGFFKIPLFITKLITIPIDFLERLINKDLKINSMRVKKFTVTTNFHSDLIREIGFKQNVSIEQAYIDTIAWIKDNDVKSLREKWYNKAKKL